MAIKYYLKNKKLNIKNPAVKELIELDKKYHINMYRQWKKSQEYKEENNKSYVDPITGDAENIVYLNS